MTEQRSPDEEPIIELTEVVETSAADDSDIIELTEVVATPPAADDDIIELTDVVKSSQAEEEIIDLVDVVEEAPKVDPAVRPEAADVNESPIAVANQAQENPVEETTDDSAAVPENAAFDLLHEETSAPAAAHNPPIDGELDFAPMDLDIEESKEADLFDSLGMKLEPELQGDAENDELDFNLSTQELSDAIDLLDAKLAEDTHVDAAKTEPLPVTISEPQLEKALENVIRQMYAEKIDQMLNEAIEKTVTAEIENLKNQLLKESPEE